MKKIHTALLLAALMVPAAAQDFSPETYTQKRNVIKLSPWQLLGSKFEVGYERYSKDYMSSFQIIGTVIARKRSTWDFDIPTERYGFEGMGMYRFYYKGLNQPKNPLYRTATIRIYVAPYARAKYMQEDYSTLQWQGGITFSDGDTRLQDQSESYEGGFLTGVQLTAWDRFTFDTYFGAGWRYSNVVSNNPFQDETQIRSDNITNVGYSGIVPRINFQIGIAF